jgi:hypothetical protein
MREITTIESVDRLLESGNTEAALDWLVEFYTGQQDFISLFEVRRLKLAGQDESSEAYREALVQAARETGDLALQHGDIPAAYRFFRAIGDTAPVAAAIEKIGPGENLDQIIAIALEEGVHPAKGLELVMGQYGMCRAITVFGMYPGEKDREQCVALLVRKLHRDVVESLTRTIEAQEGKPPDSASILDLIKDRPWLFGEYDYYVDTSHLMSLLPHSLETKDEGVLRLFHELCEYGKRLSSMFQFKGQPPFDQPFIDYGEYVLAQLHDDDDRRIDHFKRKIDDPYAAQLVVSLLAERGRYDEALDISLEYLQDEDPSSLTCPTTLQLCKLARRYDRFQASARDRGDLLGYVTAAVMGNHSK